MALEADRLSSYPCSPVLMVFLSKLLHFSELQNTVSEMGGL